MKKEQFEEAMNRLDDRFIEEAANYKKPAGLKRAVRIGSLAACAVIVIASVFAMTSNTNIDNATVNKSSYMSGGSSTDYAPEEYVPETTMAQAEFMGGGSLKGGSYDGLTGEDTPYEVESGMQNSPSLDTALATASAKIIRTAVLNMESQDFDEAYNSIDAVVKAAGGYYETNSVNDHGSGSRRAELTIRLPQDCFDSVIEGVKQVCHVTYINQKAENVSERYYDIQSRLEYAKIKLGRLQELLASATEMTDIIELENAISNTQWEVDYYAGDLRHYDSLIEYSTISITLEEVQKLTDIAPEPVSFGARIKNAFMNGIKAIGDGMVNFVLWFVSNVVWIVLIAAAILAAVLIIKKKIRK